ncbi:MAG: phenylacetate--CoA ligase family protein, partial [Anaerolineae bacterium]|nr:phenylacetate--CoA ligase family protein [Anaerolineae bacterium]
MSAYTNLLRTVALPAGSMLAGYRDVMPYLRGLEESQWWSPAEIRALQDRKLRRLVSHVYRNVPFYRRWMDEHGVRPKDVRTLDDLHLLPVVDKHVLVANFPDELRDHSLPQEQLIQAASSGSTGERLHYWTTKTQKAKKWAGLFRWWELTGWQF